MDAGRAGVSADGGDVCCLVVLALNGALSEADDARSV